MASSNSDDEDDVLVPVDVLNYGLRNWSERGVMHIWEENMATGNATTPAAAAKSDRSFNPVVGFLVCAGIVALAMASLWIGLSGLMNPDHTGGLLRTLGGFVGFFVVFGLTLVAAVRRK